MELPSDLSAHHISVLARNAYRAMLTEDGGVDRSELVLATLAQIAECAGILADRLEQAPRGLSHSSEYVGNVVPLIR